MSPRRAVSGMMGPPRDKLLAGARDRLRGVSSAPNSPARSQGRGAGGCKEAAGPAGVGGSSKLAKPRYHIDTSKAHPSFYLPCLRKVTEQVCARVRTCARRS